MLKNLTFLRWMVWIHSLLRTSNTSTAFSLKTVRWGDVYAAGETLQCYTQFSNCPTFFSPLKHFLFLRFYEQTFFFVVLGGVGKDWDCEFSHGPSPSHLSCSADLCHQDWKRKEVQNFEMYLEWKYIVPLPNVNNQWHCFKKREFVVLLWQKKGISPKLHETQIP